ncbi:MAG: replication-relaxation family protein [Pseudomonadota bacterium]
MKTHDRLGRRLFTAKVKEPIFSRHPTQREIRWLQFLNFHRFGSTSYLHECTADTHRCMQTTKRMLRGLFDAGLTCRPVQQRNTADARGNEHIYALTQSGIDYLKDHDLWVDALKPNGPWVHQFMISCITASIQLLAERSGYRFIPGHEITKSLAAAVPFTWRGKQHSMKLIPDGLFAIEYPAGFVAYVLEADRSTETIDPVSPYRKSVRRNVKQYKEFVGNGLYKEAYGLTCPLIVLNVAISATHIKQSLAIIEEEVGDCSYMTYGLAPMFRTPFKPPKELLSRLFTGDLLRCGCEPIQMKR